MIPACPLFGIDDVEVADVTTTDDVIAVLFDVLEGCKITNVGAGAVLD